jgi:flavin reductase (DIM6/NTAB) family NADH-FMN oxidoreductase RutF
VDNISSESIGWEGGMKIDTGTDGITVMAVDPTKAAMEVFTATVDYPLYVVTVGSGSGELSGCLAGFVTQCSIVPPRFLVCISKVNHTFSVGERSPGIAIHLLGHDQTELASMFAEETGDCVDKFERCRWHPGRSGAPVLEDCAAWLDGSVIGRGSVGDHEAFLMSPLAGGSGGHRGPLTYRECTDLEPGHPSA